MKRSEERRERGEATLSRDGGRHRALARLLVLAPFRVPAPGVS